MRARINPELPSIEKPLPGHDPTQRQPFINLAIAELDWQSTVFLEQGLEPTIEWFKSLLKKTLQQQ